MRIKNKFTVPLAVPDAWIILNDIPRVARCAPGAELVESRADGSYVGIVRVRLGPVALSFRGVLTYKERDESRHRVVAEANGDDEHARGTARALVTFELSAVGDATVVDVDTDLQLAGSIAQYGRGSALIESTAQVLMNDFAKNFATEFGSDVGSKGITSDVHGSPDARPRTQSVSGFSLMLKALAALLKTWFRGLLERHP
jgi:carbon monoxide dehydrogenase subunit G